jgi:hypothetical protein
MGQDAPHGNGTAILFAGAGCMMPLPLFWQARRG